MRKALIVLGAFMSILAVAAVGAETMTPEGQHVHYHINDNIYWGEPTWVSPTAYHYGTGHEFIFVEWDGPTLDAGAVADCTFSPRTSHMTAHDASTENIWHDNAPDGGTSTLEFSPNFTRHVIEVMPENRFQWWFVLECDFYDADENFTFIGADDPPDIPGTITVSPTSVEAWGEVTLTGTGFTVPSFLLSASSSPTNCATEDWPSGDTIFPTADGTWTFLMTVSDECAAGPTHIRLDYGHIGTGQLSIQTITVTAPTP